MGSEVTIEELGPGGKVTTYIDGDAISQLEPAVMKRVIHLKQLHEQYEAKETEYEKELRKLDQKYAEFYDKIFAERAEIVKGEKQPETEQAIEEKLASLPLTDKEGTVGIPGFWQTVFTNSRTLSELVEDSDLDALEHLVDVRSTDFYGEDGTEHENEEGFDLIFEFSDNPYFTDKTLTKTYRLDDGELTLAKGSSIHWKPGKNLTQKTMRKKAGGKGKGGKPGKALETKTEDLPSFFRFFSPPELKPEEDGPMDKADALALQDDYELGEEIKHEIIPNAVNFFLGEVDEDSEDDEDDEYYDEDDSDEDDDDEDEEEEDSEEEDAEDAKAPTPKGRRKVALKDKAKAQDQPAECKQQ